MENKNWHHRYAISMKRIIGSIFTYCFTFGIHAQCPGVNDVGFEIGVTQPSGFGGNCWVVAENPDHIMAYENFYIYLTLPDGINNTNFDFLMDGVPAPNLYVTAPNNSQGLPPSWVQFLDYYRTWIVDPGVHVYELRVYNNGCPTIVKTDTIEIFERDCPYVESGYASGVTYCFLRDSSIEVQLTTNTGDPIIGTTWEIFHTDFPFYTYANQATISFDQSEGDEYTFNWPYPGTYQGNGYAEILLPDGTTCLSKIDGSTHLCPSFGATVIFSDSYFELEGDLECGEDVDVIFKGDMMFKTSNPEAGYDPFTYTLYLNGSQVSAFADLQYDQLVHTFSTLPPGENTIMLVGVSNKTCPDTTLYTLNIESPCTPIEVPCESCNTFRPQPGERYWVSAWVKENQANQVKTYTNPRLEFGFTGSGVAAVPFYPSGDIVEGWQRIVGSFTIPANTTALDIKLVNGHASMEAYFDDIRIHPYNASMKSYVYDPATYLLSAELDDNNYATFYEYDKEGQLIRIKKETARGIMTIQESRSSNPKR